MCYLLAGSQREETEEDHGDEDDSGLRSER